MRLKSYTYVDHAITFEVNHNINNPYRNINSPPLHPCGGVGMGWDGGMNRDHQCYDLLRMLWHSQHACAAIQRLRFCLLLTNGLCLGKRFCGLLTVSRCRLQISFELGFAALALLRTGE
jgi:hypothetical protein